MKNKLYVHIGLHKTATTSMQKYIFPNLPTIRFIGRADDVLLKQDPFYLKLAGYCFSTVEKFDVESEIKNEIKVILKTQNILISDEWFTTDFDGFYKFKGAGWQLKLLKLSRIVKGIDNELLVTLRAPFDGAFSQYCEFNQVGIEQRYPTFERYIFESNDSLVYKYVQFDKFLNDNFKSIRYIQFEELIKNPQVLAQFFSVECELNMLKSNSKNREKAGIYVKKKSNSMMFLMNLLPQNLINKLKNIAFFKHLASKLFKVFSSKQLISIPNENEKKKIIDFLVDSKNFHYRVGSNKE